jgi:hypothetical protein
VKDPVHEYLSKLGKKGGKSKSPAKMAAMRETLKKARIERWAGKKKKGK